MINLRELSPIPYTIIEKDGARVSYLTLFMRPHSLQVIIYGCGAFLFLFHDAY